jgi:PII-like signaling protein
MMNMLDFYVSEKQHHDGRPLYEWLLEEGRALGIHGGSAFRAIAGFGRHGTMHEDTFFELAGELAVKVEFIVDDEHADKLLAVLHAQNMNIFYLRSAVQAGVV